MSRGFWGPKATLTLPWNSFPEGVEDWSLYSPGFVFNWLEVDSMALSPSPAIPILFSDPTACQRKFLSAYKDTLLEPRGVSML